MMDPSEIVTVYEAANVTEAHLVKNLLAEEDILATVTEQNEVLGLPITPTHVMVRKSDEVRAMALITEYDQAQIDRAEMGDDDDDSDDDDMDDEVGDVLDSVDEDELDAERDTP